MRVLGIDPGIARTGWAVLEEKNGKIKALAFDCFETKANEQMPQRLIKIHKEIRRIVKKYSPHSIAIEELFFSTNAKTAFAVGQARGVIVLACAQEKTETFSYTPLQVKMAVSGYGKADKGQVGKMVKAILNLKQVPKLDDTCDAIAIGLTHLFSAKMKSKN
jgi:crossover junction endodeoxyribonuclease RuvC